MARLPIPGGDENSWGNVLNEYLSQSHNTDGTLKSTAVQAAVLDATAATKGVIQLTGDLSGPAEAPTVPGLAAHVNDPTGAHAATAISFAPTGTITATDTQGAIVEVESDLQAQINSITTQGPGLELAVAQKSDGLFSTTSTTPVSVPGLSITITVPNRPYMIRFIGMGTVSGPNQPVTVAIYDQTNTMVSVPAGFTGSTAGGVVTFVAEARVPTPFHTPTAGTSMTYDVRAYTANATVGVTILTGPLFANNLHASLVAVTQ